MTGQRLNDCKVIKKYDFSALERHSPESMEVVFGQMRREQRGGGRATSSFLEMAEAIGCACAYSIESGTGLAANGAGLASYGPN